MSERWNMKIKLCGRHHNLSDEGVHFDKDKDLHLKKMAQEEFEKKYGHDKFMQDFKKNYL